MLWEKASRTRKASIPHKQRVAAMRSLVALPSRIHMARLLPRPPSWGLRDKSVKFIVSTIMGIYRAHLLEKKRNVIHPPGQIPVYARKAE